MTRPKTLTVRTPEDVLAMVPYVLGFHPEESVVLMTVGPSGTPFHARVDLPPDREHLGDLVDVLVDAAGRNGARQSIVVLYTADRELAHDTVSRLRAGLLESGVEILAALCAHAGEYVDLERSDCPARAYDVASHPLTVQAVFDGRVTYRDRQALSDSLTTDGEASAAVAALCRRAAHRLAGAARHPLGPAAPATFRSTLVAEGQWARERLRRAVAEASVLDDSETARLLVALVSVELRDVLWAEIDRADAPSQVRFWSDIVRRAPLEYAAPPAALLAFAAWMAGDGALAWCALDRCREADETYSMAHLVGVALQNAIPPSSWKPIDPASLTLFAG